MLYDVSELKVKGSTSIIDFAAEGVGAWQTWDRYLTVDGKKAFHIGNICGTCEFFFERLEGANNGVNKRVNVEAVVNELNAGIRKLDPALVKALSLMVPDGKYKVLLQDIQPRLVIPREEADYFTKEQVTLWGVDAWEPPHFPHTEYYRLKTKTISDGKGFFEFLVPMFPHGWLQQERLDEYAAAFKNGGMPTAVSISVFDVKSPADWDEKQDVTSHCCLAHYLIDGHHKAYAAAEQGKPITLLSFLAVNQGISSEEDIAQLVQWLR